MKTNAENSNTESVRERLLAYGSYTKLIESIKHFDGVQSSYRSLASTLLLATYAVIGFFLARTGAVLDISSLLGVALASLGGVVILTSLGFADLGYQERLLLGSYVQALILERTHKWLPQLHHLMVHEGARHSSATRKSTFYIGCSSTLLLTAGIALICLFRSHLLLSVLIGGPATIVAIVGYAAIFGTYTGRSERLAVEVFLHSWHLKKHG